MKLGPIAAILIGAGLMGWGLYEIDEPYLTFVVGVFAAIIGLTQVTPDAPNKPDE